MSTPRIRMFDYLVQYERLEAEVLGAVRRAFGSGRLILGPENEAFEREYAAYLGLATADRCVAVANGTDALVVALMALGIGHGDEVVTVANTAVPTVSAIRAVGATPVFCDVDPRTCLMEPTGLPACLTGRTRAVVPVHLFGNVVEVPAVREILAGRNVHIIEDTAQAHGATLNGRMAGTMGDIGTFSFYPTKNLGAYGDGGLCCSPDLELAAEMRRVRMYGFAGRYYAEREGINSRMDEVQAAILRVKLAHLPEFVARRRTLAQRYLERLPEMAEPVQPGVGVDHSYHLFVVKVPDRDRVRNELAARGIDTGVHYADPVHLMRAYDFLGYREGDLPHTEALAKSILSLPLYPELPEESVVRVCEVLKEVLG